MERIKVTLPKTFHFNPALRWFTILLGFMASGYSAYVIITKITLESSGATKIIPFVIIFFAMTSLMRNLITLNTVRLEETRVIFGCILKKAIAINWTDIYKIHFQASRYKAFRIYYKENGEEKMYLLTISFPKMVEIINMIVQKCPHAETDEFVDNVAPKDA